MFKEEKYVLECVSYVLMRRGYVLLGSLSRIGDESFGGHLMLA